MGRTMIRFYCHSLGRVLGQIVLDIDDTFDTVHGYQQLRLFKAKYDGYIFHPIVVCDGDGRWVGALRCPERRPKGAESTAHLRRLISEMRKR